LDRITLISQGPRGRPIILPPALQKYSHFPFQIFSINILTGNQEDLPAMVFRRYDASIKIATVRMSLQNHSQAFIRDSLGVTVSRQSFIQWMELYHKTQRVVRNPEEYSARGRPSLLSAEDREFMVDLVCNEPSLFLDEIRERLYDNRGHLLSITAIQQTLVNKLSITLKKPSTVNIRKSLSAKFRWIENMIGVPAEFLVFTGKFQ
jgi:transposase